MNTEIFFFLLFTLWHDNNKKKNNLHLKNWCLKHNPARSCTLHSTKPPACRLKYDRGLRHYLYPCGAQRSALSRPAHSVLKLNVITVVPMCNTAFTPVFNNNNDRSELPRNRHFKWLQHGLNIKLGGINIAANSTAPDVLSLLPVCSPIGIRLKRLPLNWRR